MGLLDKLFGTTDAVKDLIEAGANTVDRFVLTKQEKLDYEKLKNEQDYRLKTFEAENFQKELDRQLEYYKTDAVDRADARDLQVKALSQDDLFSKRFIYYFAIFITTLQMIYAFGVTFFEVPEKNIRNADTLLGIMVGSGLTAIITFFYGSSLGSSIKNETIKKLS